VPARTASSSARASTTPAHSYCSLARPPHSGSRLWDTPCAQCSMGKCCIDPCPLRCTVRVVQHAGVGENQSREIRGYLQQCLLAGIAIPKTSSPSTRMASCVIDRWVGPLRCGLGPRYTGHTWNRNHTQSSPSEGTREPVCALRTAWRLVCSGIQALPCPGATGK